ncbi:MAG: acyl carrier protein [Clostridia bacterium]|nr:acyl carrier protein [Clostridiales bacterium]MBR2030406.1 acyl carrier protein [Clostridia bacterium]MBR2303351.1 acyl carrier protein [Clostridia bacterium]
MIFEKIRKLLAEQINISQDEIKMESDIIEDLGADSLDVVEMLMAVETEFNVTVPDEIAMEMKTIGDVVAFIEKNQ